MTPYSPEEIEQHFQELPEALKEQMLSADNSERIFQAGKKFGLTVEQVGFLAEESGYVVLGLTRPNDFVTRLRDHLGIDNETAKTIAQEINHQIFFPLREMLKTAHQFEITQEKIQAAQPTPIMPKPQAPLSPPIKPTPPIPPLRPKVPPPITLRPLAKPPMLTPPAAPVPMPIKPIVIPPLAVRIPAEAPPVPPTPKPIPPTIQIPVTKTPAAPAPSSPNQLPPLPIKRPDMPPASPMWPPVSIPIKPIIPPVIQEKKIQIPTDIPKPAAPIPPQIPLAPSQIMQKEIIKEAGKKEPELKPQAERMKESVFGAPSAPEMIPTPMEKPISPAVNPPAPISEIQQPAQPQITKSNDPYREPIE